jgi:hypothetical protein
MTSKSNVQPVATQAPPANQASNLFFSVKTFDPQGKDIGFRVVDLYHFGTRKWLQDHLWWALHHHNLVEINEATPEETDAYLVAAKAALAEKFNGPIAAEAEAKAA